MNEKMLYIRSKSAKPVYPSSVSVQLTKLSEAVFVL